MITLEHFCGAGKVLARKIGVPAAFRLLQRFGGQAFYIAKEPNASHETSRKLGLPAHEALASLWPAQEFELPMVDPIIEKAEREKRDLDIIADNQRLSMREMIIKYGLTRGQLQNILRQNDEPEQAVDDTPVAEQLKLAGI